MRGDYAIDNFTESDVMAVLDGAGLRHRNGQRYILSQCPLHEDKNASCQIYKDDWFVKCHAGCEGGRFHITKAFPELRGVREYASGSKPLPRAVQKKEPKVNYINKTAEITAMWQKLPPIPDDHMLKLGLPAEILNDHQWKYDENNQRYLIPYFSRSKKSIPFAQWRNLQGSVRFNFWKDAQPTMYGTWNLEPGEKIFLVEGTSDAMVLDHCMIPWISAPSAASGELVKKLAAWCKDNNTKIVYAGDNDAAGNKLKEALDTVTKYRVRQPRTPYKDWGEMFEAEGEKSVINWCHGELFRGEPLPFPEIEPGYKTQTDQPEGWSEMSDVERVKTIFPGATELRIVDTEKKQLETESTVLF